MKAYAGGKHGKGNRKPAMKGGNTPMATTKKGAKGNRYPK